jgi:epoxyqueuosine reductase
MAPAATAARGGRRPDDPTGVDALLADVAAAGRRAGLDVVGVAPAAGMGAARRVIERRKADGLHAGMYFTYGHPERSTDPARLVPGAASIVVGARSYRRAVPARPEGAMGRVARYAWHDHYDDLRDGLGAMADVLRAAGHRAEAVADDNRLVDRAAAYLAGIGWFGTNTNLILPGRGSYFALGAVVTDAVLPTAAPVPDGCGTCTRCQPACPTGALDEPGVLDARRCLAWLVQAPGTFPREHRVALGDRLYGCDECQEVCPHNELPGTEEEPPAEPGSTAWVDVVGLLECGDDELMAHYGRWYVPRRHPSGLRRNALVVLGNVGHGDDSRTELVLRRCLAHPDPLVRGHAVWAARRLGRDDLCRALAADTDPTVVEELAAEVPVRT